jgi:hypothetical protein
MRLASLPLLLCLASAACGDSDGGGQEVDAAPPIDARLLSDAQRQACSAGSDSCSEQDYQRICDLGRAFCVECLAPSDCADPDSLGPQCQESDNTCRCSGHDDCVGRVGGEYCHPIVSACGCLTVDDCPPESACEIEPYLGTGIRRCRPI